jgi:hypothetical protein
MCAPLDWILDPSTGRDFEKFPSLRDSPCFERGRAIKKQLQLPGKFECIGQGGALGVEKLNSAAR